MAIKTKKISELDTLKDINGTYAVVGVGDGITGKITLEQIKNFVDTNKTPTTEQVSEVSKQDLKAVSSEVKKVADEVAAVKKSSDEFVTKYTNMVYTQTQKNEHYESEISKLNSFDEQLTGEDASLKKRISDLEENIGKVNDDLEENIGKVNDIIATLENPVQAIQEDNSLEQKVQELSEKVAALESFVHKLQKDGYLTLAEIRKAAAETCPICIHTHEEVTETPAE